MLAPPNRAHLQPSPWTDEKTAMLKKMHADGKEYWAIAAVVGMSRHAVAGKAFRLGLPKREVQQSGRRSGRIQSRADNDRATTMRIKTLKVRGPSNGGAQIVESVVCEEAPQPAEFLAITFGDLADGQCKFPRGEGAGIRFCGQPQVPGQPYCRNCCAVAFTYTPPPSSRPYLPTGGTKLRVF